ncbi:TetR family transcriptional regulator, partial [Micromonospora sp. NPDC002411]
MTMPRRRPGRPRRDETRPTREVVLTAATALFAERGFDAVGLREVAAATKIPTYGEFVGPENEFHLTATQLASGA